MKTRKLLYIVTLLVLALALASPAYAQGGSRPGMVSFGRDITIGVGEVINGDVVAFGGNISLDSQSKVNGSVVSFGGNVASSGEVAESIVSFGGNIDLRSGSSVLEDVVAFGGEVTQAESARVLGNVSKGWIFEMDGTRSGRPITPRVSIPPEVFTRGPESLLASIVLGLFRAVLTVLVLTAVAVVLVAIFPKPVEGVRTTISTKPASSAGIGCLAFLVAMAISVPLIITCIGPILLWTGIAIAYMFGLAAMGLWLGERLSVATSGRFSPLASTAIGTALIVLLLSVVEIVPLVECFGWVLWLLVGSLALGAVVWSRFGTQLPAEVVAKAPSAGTWQTPGAAAAPPPASGPGPVTSTPAAVAAELAAPQESVPHATPPAPGTLD